ncbi:MAG: hypothetical protein ACFFDN_19885 [Candidatus Hodarchaeota archaeon]
MLNNLRVSRARLIIDALLSDMSKWWTWDEILEKIVPGFGNLPIQIQVKTILINMTYIPHVYDKLDKMGFFLLTDGKGRKRRFKIATTKPEDKPEIERCLIAMQDREDSYSNKKQLRIENLEKEKMLPFNFRRKKLHEINKKIAQAEVVQDLEEVKKLMKEKAKYLYKMRK